MAPMITNAISIIEGIDMTSLTIADRPHDNYTLIANSLARDAGISSNARALMLYLLSHSSGFKISIRRLIATRMFGANELILKTMKELKSAGYIRLENPEPGIFEWFIYQERPRIGRRCDPVSGGDAPPHCESMHIRRTTLEDQSKNKYCSTSSNESPDLFEIFWKKYPRKQGKENAIKAFKKHKFDHKTLPPVLDALDAHIRFWDTKDKQFTPLPATWLNGKRWEDELEAPAEPVRPRRYFN